MSQVFRVSGIGWLGVLILVGICLGCSTVSSKRRMSDPRDPTKIDDPEESPTPTPTPSPTPENCGDGECQSDETCDNCPEDCGDCPPADAGFTFIGWADTKSAKDVLSELSDQAIELDPDFSIYPGDLENDGFTTSGMAEWKKAVNGERTGGADANGMFDITFPTRGNHDDINTSDWQDYFDLQGVAQRVGAKNYTDMDGKKNLAYSFDMGNSHFVGLDCLGGVSKLDNDQIQWLDQDLKAAAGRKLVHAFIFFHGPIYCLNGHCDCDERKCDDAPNGLIDVINDNSIVTATFHGHEHVYAYTHLDDSRVDGLTHPFHHFIIGDAGAGPKTCTADRYDYCFSNEEDESGFALFEVDGNDITVKWYKLGSATMVKKIEFSK